MLLLVTTLLKGTTLFSQVKAEDIVGVWLTSGKEPAKIQVYRSGQNYYGKIVWLQNPLNNGKPKLDANNPDKNKRNQQIVGLSILSGFEFNGDDEWDDGKIYDPESGKTYSCYLSLKNSTTLKVRGYLGLSMFGRTETWTRTGL